MSVSYTTGPKEVGWSYFNHIVSQDNNRHHRQELCLPNDKLERFKTVLATWTPTKEDSCSRKNWNCSWEHCLTPAQLFHKEKPFFTVLSLSSTALRNIPSQAAQQRFSVRPGMVATVCTSMERNRDNSSKQIQEYSLNIRCFWILGLWCLVWDELVPAAMGCKLNRATNLH